MKTRLKTGILLLCIYLLGCSPRLAPATSGLPPLPTNSPIPAGLTVQELATLNSLQKVDDYPLYTMTYAGAYRLREGTMLPERVASASESDPTWACSLFTILLDENNLLYGRNFDWQFSPALLLFTDPPDGYASASMVDLAYFGFDDTTAKEIATLPIEERTSLLDVPYLPFDGMNVHGLVIGMAAVSPGNMEADPKKETIGSIGIIRKMLDYARTVDEAVAIMQGYNIDFEGGPPIHYLIADATGNSVLVEYYDGEMHIIQNEEPWHLATNFLRSSVADPKDGGCWRYNLIQAQLTKSNGQIDTREAMQLLADVAQNNTQWSVIYQMNSGTIDVVMGQQYQNTHKFQLEMRIP
jgi:choloylglycine hydrolase